MTEFSTQVVDSLTDTVVFIGLNIPVGFLASFRKKNHSECAGGGGFKPFISAGRRSNQLCFCAVNRAVKNFRDIGSENFKKHASEWLQKHKAEAAVAAIAAETKSET